MPATVWVLTTTPGTSRVLPDGGMDLIWTGTDVLAAGADTVANVAGSARATPLVGIRLDPGVGPSVFGMPGGELTDQRATLDELWGRAEHDRWRDVLGGASDPAVALERLVSPCLDADGGPPAWVAAVVAGCRQGCNVGELAERIGYTPRHLNRLSHDRFGYGPKVLSRVLRFQRALPALRSGVDATRAAVDAGYADVAHLHREVRALTGEPVWALRAGQPAGA